MLKKESSIWLNGIKFLACVCIFLNHFAGLFYHLLKLSVEFSPIYTSVHSCFSFLLNTYFYLSLFYLISGVLAQNKPVDSLSALVKTLVLRYFRFVIPLFFAALFAYLMSIIPGYYCQPVAELFDNQSWDIFPSELMTFTNVLKCTFLFDPAINPILWTIGCIFKGTCIVYILNYLTHTLSKKLKFVIYLVVTAVLFIITKGTDVNLLAISCTVAGSVMYLLWELIPDSGISNKTATIISFLAYFILNTLYGKISAFLMRYIPVGDGDSYYMILAVDFVIAFVFLYFVFYSGTIKNLLSECPIRELYDSSFALYMVHEPVICSLSMYLFLLWFQSERYYIVVPAIFIITVLGLSVAVLIYHRSVDKCSDSMMNYVKKYLFNRRYA